VVTRRFGTVTVHAVRSGFVACKEAHRTLAVPDFLRLPAIVLDRRWTEWMPVTSYVVEHPEGVFVVDPGQREDTPDAAALDCDEGTRWFYRHQLRLAFRGEERIDRRLVSLGLDPRGVRGVVVTHRHGDHADALSVLRAQRVYVGAGDWPTHQGALPAHWPAGVSPTQVDGSGPTIDGLAGARSITRDERVCVVPLFGHSPGHLGLLVRADDGTRILCAGDAVFSLAQLRRGQIAGICERPRDARATLRAMDGLLGSHRTFLLPAHEREAVDRLARGLPASEA
jgi:glyoxylase-like metal-dependent hydrolase (beta-lactamase superfamily II)